MKTTLDLPDELVRAVKIRAIGENRKLKDEIAELLKRGLARDPSGRAKPRKRVKLPLVRCAHKARPAEEILATRVAEILLKEESEASREPVR